jgi:thiamine-phosphate diphosphorylase
VNLWEEAVIQGKTWMARDFRRLAQPACTIKEPSYLDFPKATEIDSESPIPASQDHCQPELVPVFQARDHLVRVNGLYVIADSAEKLRISFAAGARLGQLRCKSLGHDQLREEATKAMAWAKEYKATFILNDDLELAEAIGAWGVHLGQEDLQRYGRQRLMQRKVALGISTHSLKELALALDYLPDYVALGPIFPTTCKSMAFGPQGLEKVGPWAQFSGLPLVAIGGMTPETGIQAKNLGAASIAVLSDLFHHPQGIILRVEEWLRALGEC